MAYAKSGQEGKTRWELFQQSMRDFGTFMYTKDEETGDTLVMGRNGKSWAKITVFFLIFYGCLAAFFAAMMAIFLTTVPNIEDGPKMTRYLAGKQGLVPTPNEIAKFDQGNAGSYSKYVDKINNFLKPYKEASGSDKYENCTSEEREKGTKPCAVDLTSLGECYSAADNFKYGYDEGKPCIFMKMNRVYGWVPEPEDGLNYVQLDCFFDPDDRSEIGILPEATPGFAKKFYPFFSEDAWLSPIAAIKVNTTRSGVILCEANAKNLEKSETYRLNRGATAKARIEVRQ